MVWNDGFKKYMYLGDADEYGELYYNGTDSIMFFMRGLWHRLRDIGDNATLLHLRACYQYGYHEWRRIYLTWCDLTEIDPADLRGTVKAAKRHYDNTPEYKISSSGEKYRNPEYIPQSRDVCSAFLTIRNYCLYGDIKWATYWSDRDFEDYYHYRDPKFK